MDPTSSENATIICFDNCNERGVCIDGTACACYSGFFGDTCELTLTDIYPVLWPILQYILAAAYLIFFFMGVAIIFELVREKQIYAAKASSSRKISIQVMGFYTFYEFTCIFIYYIDPFGGEIIPYWLFAIWAAYRVVFGVVFLGLMLSHWIEVYHTSIKKFKKAEALQKINSNYSGNIEYEDIVRESDRMTKFRIPYLVSVAIITLFQIPTLVVQLTYSMLHFMMGMINLIFLSLFFAVFCIGFLIYGRRLHRILPVELQERLRSVSIKVNIFCVVTIVALIFYTLWNIYLTEPWAQVVYYFVNSVQQWPLTLMIFSIYARVDWKRFRIRGQHYADTNSDSGTQTTDLVEAPEQEDEEDESSD